MTASLPSRFSSLAAVIPGSDIDTDTIIPIDYCVNRKRPDFDVGLFRHWRFDDDGNERTDFVLNSYPYRAAEILVAGANFGCGSSREMAVWALADFGIRCVIAPSFGEIFYNNCYQNNVLAARVTPAAYEKLIGVVAAGTACRLTIDINAKTITGEDGFATEFELDDLRRDMLLEGLDPVAATLTRAHDIEAYEVRGRRERPWVFLEEAAYRGDEPGNDIGQSSPYKKTE